jgi:hypothetical protein
VKRLLIIAITILMLACEGSMPSIYGRITRVTIDKKTDSLLIYENNLPNILFHIIIKNQGYKAIDINVKDYGRTPRPNSGSFWLILGNEADSLELYDASCKNCFDSLRIEPRDSVDLVLQIEYDDLIKNGGDQFSLKWIDDRMEYIVNTWTCLKYIDHKKSQVFLIPREKIEVL